MKKLIILSLLIMASQALHAQEDAITKFFNKYAENENFTNIYISQKMFTMFSDIPVDENEQEVKEVINSLEGLRILSSDHVNGKKLYEEAYKTLNAKSFEELMVIRDGNQELKFLVRESQGKIRELLMLSGEENSFFILSLIGDIDLKQISKLSKTMNVKGMENLENLEEKQEE